MRWFLFCMMGLVLAGCGAGQPPNPIDASAIVPGTRIGKVALQDTRADVLEALGTPDHTWTAEHNPGLYLEGWDEPEDHQLFVYYRDEIVVQIHITSPAYTTPEGFSTATHGDTLRTRLAPLEPFINPYEVGLTYYDAVDKGIAFVATNTGVTRALFIHVPGTEMLIL